jgi:co-chaperonin GroES (HSP10)
MKIQPFGDRVVIKLLVQEENIGGLIVPVSKEKTNRGVVVAIGDGEEVSKIALGDVILFQLGTGLNYSTEKDDYKVLNARDIVGKVIEGE